jgi:hypothetical protein
MMTIRNRLRPERGEMVDGTVVPRGRLSRIPRPRRVARADACAFAHAPALGRADPQHGPDGAPVVADGHAPVRAQAPPQPAASRSVTGPPRAPETAASMPRRASFACFLS